VKIFVLQGATVSASQVIDDEPDEAEVVPGTSGPYITY
jgi:hypothetical protein